MKKRIIDRSPAAPAPGPGDAEPARAKTAAGFTQVLTEKLLLLLKLINTCVEPSIMKAQHKFMGADSTVGKLI